MTGLTSVNFFCFILISYCSSVHTSLVYENVTTLFQIWRRLNISHNVVIATTSQQNTLVSCIVHCDKLEYISFHYIDKNTTCLCSSDDDSNIDEHETEDKTIRYGNRKTKVNTSYIQDDGQTIKRTHRQPEPFDCLTLYKKGYSEDGVYVIKPTGTTSTDVWCDMSSGGWTVIQRREDGSEDFYRGWEEYKHGFGTKYGEYWLGLENIYYLTISNSSLYIYMETFEEDNVDPVSAFAEYSTFRINDESDNYRLVVGGYNGSCGDSLSYHHNCQFTTKDNDNDNNNYNCAVRYSGAWWYNVCHYANLNGLYLDGAGTDFGRGINWYKCWGHYYSLKKTTMKIRRHNYTFPFTF